MVIELVSRRFGSEVMEMSRPALLRIAERRRFRSRYVFRRVADFRRCVL